MEWNRILSFFVITCILSGSGKVVPIKTFLGNNGQLENEEVEGFSLPSIVNQYIQVAVTKNIFYYTPLKLNQVRVSDESPSYISYQTDEIGKEAVLLREEPNFSPFPGKTKYISLRRNKMRQKHRNNLDPNVRAHYVYDVINSSYRDLNDHERVGVPYTRVMIIEENYFLTRIKRSRVVDKAREILKKGKEYLFGKKEKKVIHVPAIFVDPDNDGFRNILYEEMIMTALCLTSQPELDRHELVDEYEVLLCNKKGYGKVTGNSILIQRRKREEPSTDHIYKDHDTQDSKWHMNKTHYDTLWKAEQNGTTTPHPLELEYSESIDYDYETSEMVGGRNGTGAWETDDIVVDPAELDYMSWPNFLPEGGKTDDDARRDFHSHAENFTLDYILGNLLVNQPEVQFEKRLFALNESSYLAKYYEYSFKLSPYNMKPLLIDFFDKRQETLSRFKENKLNLNSIRQLYILFTVDIHHVNCFNRHIRFYGYMMKKPASINGDEITNGVRLARGIIMRALELIRHVPQYNIHRDYLLRFLIAALKQRASLSKSLLTVIGENDYTELYEVASYLDHTRKNGIHPDEVNQDLFVQETRFYAHHFMNTLTL